MHSQASLSTSCIVNLFNPIELCSIAMHYGGQYTNSNAFGMSVSHVNFQKELINTLNWTNMQMIIIKKLISFGFLSEIFAF